MKTETRQLAALVRHAFRVEFREQAGVVGLALFAFASVYAAYQVVGARPSVESFNALTWVVLLFTAFNSVTREVAEDRAEVRAYLRCVVKPRTFLMSRIIYHTVLMSVLGVLILLAFALFMGTEHIGGGRFWALLAGLECTAWALASMLTLLSAIAVQAGSGFGLTAVLGLPLVIPIVLVATRYGTNLLTGMAFLDTAHHLLFLAALGGGTVALGYVLYPYLWRD